MTVTADTAEQGDHGSLASITINAGVTSGTGTITTAQDADTDDETFTVALGNVPSTVTAGSPNSVTVTINDDDSATTGGGADDPPPAGDPPASPPANCAEYHGGLSHGTPPNADHYREHYHVVNHDDGHPNNVDLGNGCYRVWHGPHGSGP